MFSQYFDKLVIILLLLADFRQKHWFYWQITFSSDFNCFRHWIINKSSAGRSALTVVWILRLGEGLPEKWNISVAEPCNSENRLWISGLRLVPQLQSGRLASDYVHLNKNLHRQLTDTLQSMRTPLDTGQMIRHTIERPLIASDFGENNYKSSASPIILTVIRIPQLGEKSTWKVTYFHRVIPRKNKRYNGAQQLRSSSMNFRLRQVKFRRMTRIRAAPLTMHFHAVPHSWLCAPTPISVTFNTQQIGNSKFEYFFRTILFAGLSDESDAHADIEDDPIAWKFGEFAFSTATVQGRIHRSIVQEILHGKTRGGCQTFSRSGFNGWRQSKWEYTIGAGAAERRVSARASATDLSRYFSF